MNESKHTPEWTYNHVTSQDFEVVDDNGRVIAYPLTEANAAHIVRCVNAYPIMLEALKDLRRLVAEISPSTNTRDELDDLVSGVYCKIKAAIKAAEGKTE